MKHKTLNRIGVQDLEFGALGPRVNPKHAKLSMQPFARPVERCRRPCPAALGRCRAHKSIRVAQPKPPMLEASQVKLE